jgi:hypothetical protein
MSDKSIDTVWPQPAELEAVAAELADLRAAAGYVMDLLQFHATDGTLPAGMTYLMGTDDNPGQRLRELIGNIKPAGDPQQATWADPNSNPVGDLRAALQRAVYGSNNSVTE